MTCPISFAPPFACYYLPLEPRIRSAIYCQKKLTRKVKASFSWSKRSFPTYPRRLINSGRVKIKKRTSKVGLGIRRYCMSKCFPNLLTLHHGVGHRVHKLDRLLDLARCDVIRFSFLYQVRIYFLSTSIPLNHQSSTGTKTYCFSFSWIRISIALIELSSFSGDEVTSTRGQCRSVSCMASFTIDSWVVYAILS